jgi:hypothetical protein
MRAISPGFLVERRQFLGASACALLLHDRMASAPGSWEQFLADAPKQVADLAQRTQPREIDAYLYLLASLAVRVETVPECKLTRFAELEPEVRFGMLQRAAPFFVVEWQLAPGATLPAHCHPGFSVCTLALEGEAEIRHYEAEPGAPAFDSKSEQAFALRETRRQLLRPGAVSTLSPTRDNLHFFRAGATGARGIDITTAHGGEGKFSFVAFTPDSPREAGKMLYEARWVGMNPR